MKTIFQFLIIASMLSILLDITACTREKSLPSAVDIEGQFVDILTRQPVRHVELRMEAPNGRDQVTAVSDETGHFRVTLPPLENPDYSLYVQDKCYKVVNANSQVSRFHEKQVWYLLPVNTQ